MSAQTAPVDRGVRPAPGVAADAACSYATLSRIAAPRTSTPARGRPGTRRPKARVGRAPASDTEATRGGGGATCPCCLQ